MSDVNKLLKDLNNFVYGLHEENIFLKRGYDEVKRENERLKDNEKEMLKVSSIITTSNENTKLKNYISILEEQLQKYKSNTKIVFEEIDQDHDAEDQTSKVHDPPSNNVVEEEDLFSNNLEINQSKTPSIIDDSLNTDLRVFKYKNETYFIDENNILYENNDNEKGNEVGKRKLNKKTNKFKTILY